MSTIPLAVSIFLFQTIYFSADIPIFSLISALILLAIPILVIINVIRKKVIVEPDQVICVGIFSRKRLPFNSIKGYRIGFKNIYLEPKLSSDPTISIHHYRDLENGLELKEWIRTAFLDLNATDLSSQYFAILTDIRLGATEESRKKTLASLRLLTQIYNVASLLLALMLILNDGKIALLVLLVYPFIGVLLMVLGRGLIKFQSDRHRSLCSFVLFGVFVPGFALLIKSMANDQILDSSQLWIPALVLSLFLFVLIYLTGINKSMGMLRVQVVAMTLTALSYGFGSTVQANCVFDSSSPTVYDVAVLDSRVSESSSRITGEKNKSYYLTISQWGPRREANQVTVPGNLYWQTQKGDTLRVHLSQGLLHIPWFYITNKKFKISE